MKTTTVKPMKCEIASEGLLWIDKIATGVGIIIFNPRHKVAAGIHILRGRSRGDRLDNPAYFADTGIAHVIQYFRENGLEQDLSVAIAGGASLLAASEGDRVGELLVKTVKDILGQERLTVKLEGTGGNHLRTMILNIDEGKIKIS